MEGDQNPINELQIYRKVTFAYLIVTSIGFGLVGAVVFFPSLMSVMAYDSASATDSFMSLLPTHLIVFSFISFSPMCLLSIIISWIIYHTGKYKIARVIALLPLLNVAVIAIKFALSYLLSSIK